MLIGSCKGQTTAEATKTKNALITFSKGRCLGNCPVYDMWVFNDGKIIYNGIKNVPKTGYQTQRISDETLEKIKHLVEKSFLKATKTQRIRDLPLTTLVSKGKSIRFHSNLAKAELLELNTLFESIRKTKF